jgi:hypothetical protein
MGNTFLSVGIAIFFQGEKIEKLKAMKKNLCLFMLLSILFTGYAQAQSARVTLTPDKRVADYGPVIKDALTDLANKGGGTLTIPYGEYPILTGVVFENHKPGLVINITGQKDSKGRTPVFSDRNRAKKPHLFFWLIGNIANPRLTVNVSNIQIIGNNMPYTSSNPFYGSGAEPVPAFRCSNVYTVSFSNVIIKDVYGDGIALINGFDNHNNDKKNRIESPVIRNCKILNCWSWNGKDDGGDGIMMWSVNRPVIESCTILNDLNVTKYFSRAGIVIEHNSESAVIRNNTIGGYQRNIHIEGTYGGHIVEKNRFSQSSIAVTLNEFSLGGSAALYKPIKIINNTIEYTPSRYNIKRPFREWSFISMTMKGDNLNDVIIEGNTFTYTGTDSRSVQSKKQSDLNDPDNVYIQTRGYKKVRQGKNTFK